jgi:8-oxo-dGTP pyrophosphatase MutT (NUDIX family)
MSAAPLVPASTLVLLGRRTRPLSVLLLQRAASLKAFPGLWVFPGGRVDAADRDIRWLSGLKPTASVLAQIMRARDQSQMCLNTAEYLRRMQIKADVPSHWMNDGVPADLWPHWVAAIRECHEETGLAIAGWTADQPLNFRSVHYLGRLVAPPQVPYRFDTRFFATLIDPGPVAVQEPEATRYRWVGVVQALTELELANPTRYVLQWLSQWSTAEDFENRWEKDEARWKN